MADLPLRVVTLGGFGEIGKNMLALEYENDILVIDAGLMFPESDMLGIDLVYPDITYLTERADRLQAIVLTHGHEDHIGALPYLLKYLDVPVYATALTRGLAEIKLKEAGLLADSELHTVTPDDVLELGAFRVEFFHVCHSIPDAVGIIVHTPVGVVVHATDFKFDQEPVDGKLTEVDKLRAVGDRGVLVLLSDSTNADTPGFTPSERRIDDTLADIMSDCAGSYHPRHLRIQHLTHTAGDPGGARVRPPRRRGRAEHGQQRPHGDRAELSRHRRGRPAEHLRDEQPAARAGRHRLHRQPGRAERSAGAAGCKRAPAIADPGGRYCRPLRHPDSRQRGDGRIASSTTCSG